jgi:hypothetical protein
MRHIHPYAPKRNRFAPVNQAIARRQHFASATPFWLLFLLAFSACQKVIQPNLSNGSPQMVIVGEVTNTPPPYQISITQSVDFYSDNGFPNVSGAEVILKDSTTGVTDSLSMDHAGVYTTTTFPEGVPGHTYCLLVRVQGVVYSSVSTMPPTVPLDSLGFLRSSLMGEMATRPVPYFQDPTGSSHYYRFVEYDNDKQISRILVFDDRLSNGRYISEPLANDTIDHILPGNTLEVDLECIDQPTYNYFYELGQITYTGTQATAAANPQSNIGGGGLGYFSAHTVSAKMAVVP